MRFLAIPTLITAIAFVPLASAQEDEPAAGLAPDYRAAFAANVLPVEMVIGPQDVLEIDVFNLDELSSMKRVSPTGSITLPLIGEIGVGGLTAQQAEVVIATMLKAKRLVLDPQVTVFIKDYVSRRISVHGAVTNSGVYEMLGQRTLLDMIGEAGGVSDKAGDKIFIMRAAPEGGADERIEVDLEKLVYEADPTENYVLRPGDIVMVPFERTIRVYVNGAVSRPGVQEFPDDEDVTVLQAITSAGGSTDRASESGVQVIRRFPDGTKQIFKVNLKRIKRGKQDDMLLEPNDIVVVRESFF